MANPWTQRRRPGVPGRRRGTCDTCRRTDVTLRTSDGKVMPHGKTAANPLGCPGGGQPPRREQVPPPAGELPVGELRPTVPHDQAPEPVLDIAVMVERRDAPPVTIRSSRPPPDGAA